MHATCKKKFLKYYSLGLSGISKYGWNLNVQFVRTCDSTKSDTTCRYSQRYFHRATR